MAAATPARAAQSPAAAVVPFTIHVPDVVLTDLKDRLARTRYPDQVDGAGWDYGTNLAYLKELVAYWRDTFDWREQERRLNRFEQFKTNIDGLDVHFVHRRARRPNALPLLIVHGWPGSFMQFHKYNLKRFTTMPRGGHFGAFEEPQLYLDDVRAFFEDVR
jgi:pimeloyl-ACP methyl ester carboxylesterase